MPIHRVFLDWTLPALPAVVDYLVERFARGGRLALDRLILVVPGSRAGRRLLEQLVDRAEAESLVLFPPEICTAGRLPELLYEPQRPFASDLVQQLAWAKALRDTDRDTCLQFFPQLPADDSFADWLRLGRLLWRQHRELAADALDFADVARQGPGVAGFQQAESNRWSLLDQIQRRYLAQLDDLGLWDLQTARLVAIRNRECQTDRDIVLVATADMNRATRQMLDQVAERVVTLVHAPSSCAERFDAHGCLEVESWLQARTEIDSSQIQIVDSPDDQAREVVRQIASHNGEVRADQVVVGVLDERLVPNLQRHLSQAGATARWVVGKTLGETLPYRLLEALAGLLQRLRFQQLAALVRHPDVAAWLQSQGLTGLWLAELDEYYNEHLPATIRHWPGDAQASALPRELTRLLDIAIEPLREPAQPLAQWSSAIARTLAAFYGARTLDPGEPDQYYVLKSLDALRDALLEQQDVPPVLSPVVDADDAIRLLLESVRSAPVAPPADSQAIELLGWLELPLDTAPLLVVTSFNEGFVPSSTTADLFLPDALRHHLGLLDNARRYARDAYALAVLTASRPDLTLIVGRHTADGDALVPSRLLLATDDETLVERAALLFRPTESAERARHPIDPVSGNNTQSAFLVPRPQPPARPVERLSVTAFRDYLACPYRFYLRHVLRLGTMDDAAEELGAALFGTILHDVLSQFGQDPICSSTNAGEIEDYLHRVLDTQVEQRLGSLHLPAVDIQLVQARTRLNAFAQWQAEWAGQGWRIRYAETGGGDQPVRFPLQSPRSLVLAGRIDRIDYHSGTNQWAVFDYKTGDSGKTPQETHVKSGQWIDLQLPLYRHLAASLGIAGPVQLGYIVLPRDVSKVGPLLANWDATLLAAADAEAAHVVQGILDNVFWPPSQPPPPTLAEFAAVCQDGSFRPRFE